MPVIQFGGPWMITPAGPLRFTVGREADVTLVVGTAGIGRGSTAYLDYEGVIPNTAHPTLELAYPPKHPGDSPVRERYELKERC